MSKTSFALTQGEVKKNIENLKAFMAKEGLDAFYISSFDPYLNEYVPMENCHRFYFTNFDGSVAEALALKDGKVKLYVDGRYWQQADLQVDASLVEVVKVESNKTLSGQLLEDIEKIQPKLLGFEADRASFGFFEKLSAFCETKGYYEQELESVVDFQAMPELNPVKLIAREYRGADTEEKLARILKDEKRGYFVTAIDSLAWITNCRGYHLPNLSSFLGKGLVLKDRVYVFVDPSVELDSSVKENKACAFVSIPASELEAKLKELQAQHNLEQIEYDPSMLNVLDMRALREAFGEERLVKKAGGLVEFHSIKDPQELAHMEECFRRADKAIYNTIRWVKESLAQGKKISELDLYNMTSEKYREQGAVEQSFGTISGVGPNGAIIHYGDPKADVEIKDSDMVLLDSGGYFEGGFATDTTRTFMASDKEGESGYKKIYTLVLKGLLNCQHAVFPDGISGKVLDGYARQPLYQHGMDFRHGTGHGVGIHVHEGGVRISSLSDMPMKAGQVVSIEPGLYLPEYAGVRLENIAYVEKHPEFEGYLRFRPLVYIGYEPKLIDEELLSPQEKQWLSEYEEECSRRGTSFS